MAASFDPIDSLRLKTATRTNGFDLAVGPWTTTFEPNPSAEHIRQTDWSGGMGMKILPRERDVTNMCWISTCWTASGNEILAGPLRQALEGTAITAATPQFFVEEPQANRLYFAAGAKKYYISGTSGPTEVDAGQATTVTDIVLCDDRLCVCLGTGTVLRKYTFSTTTWANGTRKAQTMTIINGAEVWASNPTSGGVACYYYWGDSAGQYCLVGDSQSPITSIVEYDNQTIIFKTDGMYMLIEGTTKKAKRIMAFHPKTAFNGLATAVYNGALYFGANNNLWRWSGAGMPVAIPMPKTIETGQIGRVYSLQSIGDALLVGCGGWALIMVKYPPDKDWYWWHYLARANAAQFRGIHYTENLGLTYPRVFFGLNTESTNRLQYCEFTVGDFRPRQFAASSYTIFPGIFSGPELYPMWIKSINYGTRDCATGKTVAWSYATSAPTIDTSFTSLGSATTSNGFQTLTPSANVNAQLLWLRTDLATDSATVTPVLDYYNLRYYPRSPTVRVWKFPVLLSTSASLPTGGRQRSVDMTEDDLVAARNQANPCTITLKSQDIEDQKVFVDFQWLTTAADAKRSTVKRENVMLICREAA